MNTTEFLNHISQTFAEGKEIIIRKNTDYAASDDPFKNFKASLVVGVQPDRAILVRVLDKLSRISNLLEIGAGKVTDESIDDTIIDLINYMAILRAYRASQKGAYIPMDVRV